MNTKELDNEYVAHAYGRFDVALTEGKGSTLYDEGGKKYIDFGSGIGGFDTFVAEHNTLLNRGPQRVSPLFIPKMISNIAAGNIAIKYGAKGPCISVSTACATGTTAVGEAYRAIKHGYADAIIAGRQGEQTVAEDAAEEVTEETVEVAE